MTLSYRVELVRDLNDTVMVVCAALPELTTYGDDAADALRHAVDAAEQVLAGYVAHDESIPPADAGPMDSPAVRLPLLTSLKLDLYEACRTCGVTRADLARRLGWHREQVDRLFRLNHASRLDQLEVAFKAVGRRIDLEVRGAA